MSLSLLKKSRLAGLVVGGAVLAGGLIAGALPTYAATGPTGTYAASLNPYLSTVTGYVTLTHDQSGWVATAQLAGLTKGHKYEYEASVADAYVSGQAVGWRSVMLCSFVATAAKGSCGAAGVGVGQAALSPQSGAFVYSPEAHTSVAVGPYSYLAALAGYDGFSKGGTASVIPDPDGTFSGRVQVSGLAPGASYTWAVDVADAYQNGQAVGWDRVVLCQFTAQSAGNTGCTASEVSLDGLSYIPAGSYSDVASTVTSVATGTLY